MFFPPHYRLNSLNSEHIFVFFHNSSINRATFTVFFYIFLTVRIITINDDILDLNKKEFLRRVKIQNKVLSHKSLATRNNHYSRIYSHYNRYWVWVWVCVCFDWIEWLPPWWKIYWLELEPHKDDLDETVKVEMKNCQPLDVGCRRRCCNIFAILNTIWIYSYQFGHRLIFLFGFL